MTPTLRAALEVGRPLFEQGAFHQAHEVWEAGWRRAKGRDRTLLQVLVLWSAGLFQQERGKPEGARRLLLRALERLGSLGDDAPGIDLEGLREGVLASCERSLQPWDPSLRPAWPEAMERLTESLEHELACPYCGEPVLVHVAPEEAEDAQYVEDCPVCCRPWQVTLRRDGGTVRVSLGRDDAGA